MDLLIAGMEKWGFSGLPGTFLACLALTIHPISVSTKSDGAPAQTRSISIHPISLSAKSDGASAQKRSNSIHPFTLSAKSDGASAQKRSNSIHPFTLSAKSDGVLSSPPLPVDKLECSTAHFQQKNWSAHLPPLPVDNFFLFC